MLSARKWFGLMPLIVALFGGLAVRADDVKIEVRADRMLGHVSRYLTGACIEDVNHEIYGGLYSQMLFGESFQEPPPPAAIAGFKAYGGRWAAAEGVVHVAGDDGPKLISEHVPFADGEVGVEVRFTDRQGGLAGLVVRVDKPGVGADKFVGYEVALDASANVLRLARHRQNYERIQDAPCEVAVGRWIPLVVKLVGSTIEVSVDGKRVLRHDDGANSLPAGAVGLRVWKCAADFRGLQVSLDKRVEPVRFKQASDTAEISGMWGAVREGDANGQFALDAKHPLVGAQSQAVRLDSGKGRWGIENQGLNRRGLSFVQGRSYDGCVWARAERPAMLFASLESRDGSRRYAETKLNVAAGDWRRIEFQLTPNEADTSGRFALTLHEPGAVTLGYAMLQPGEWGRFKGLPVRRDVAAGLIDQGITVLRYGGSMVNAAGYRWKNMIGPRERRPPYAGTWYRYSSNGWGIVDFMDFCEAADFEYVPAFNMGETPEDMADFVEYARGAADSAWGRRRAGDGRPQPYRLHYIELGNEERVDEQYAARFEALATAIWAKDPEIILVVGDFAYGERINDPFHFSGAASRITSLAGQQRILQLAKQHGREVWFDLHVNTDRPERRNASLEGMFSFRDALAKIAEGAKFKVAVFELNSGNHAMRRALANAQALLAIERDGRIPICTSANCLQPDGQNDNGWDQGLLFLNPSRVWLQPPGYVTQMLSRNYQPETVECEVSGGDEKPNAVAMRSADGQTLVLQVVNASDKPLAAEIHLAGFVPTKPRAEVTQLTGPLDAVNTAAQPPAIAPTSHHWEPALLDGATRYEFPPRSLTVIRFE